MFKMTLFVIYLQIVLTGCSISCSHDAIAKKGLYLVGVFTLSTLQSAQCQKLRAADRRQRYKIYLILYMTNLSI